MFFLSSILLLAIGDIVATHYSIIAYGTFAIEQNPLMKWVMESYGIRAAYIFRIVMPLIGVLILLWVREKSFTLGNRALWLMFYAHIALMVYHFYITKCFTLHLG